MSDKRAATDNKFFSEKFKLEIRKVISSMSGLYKLARERGIKGKDSVLSSLFNEVGKANNTYLGYRFHHLENIMDLPNIIPEKKSISILQRQEIDARKALLSELNQKISNTAHWKVRVSMTYEGCGVDISSNGHIGEFTVPMMYPKTIREIGSLGSNKVLVYAKPHKHDVYKCWKANYFTFSYKDGSRKYRSVDCFIMREKSSGITYYHVDYRLCASGLRRAIGRAISKRIG